jgi:hypothetical protein
MNRSLQLRQSRPVNNPGSELFIKIADLNIQQKNQKQTKLNINQQFLLSGRPAPALL